MGKMLCHEGCVTLLLAMAFTALACTAAVPDAAAGPEGVQWAARENRNEGLVRQQDVSGDLFRLIGVELQPPASLTQPDTLELWMPPVPARLQYVRVHELRSNYLMMPLPGQMQPGISFTWPASAVVKPAHVSVDSLRVLAEDAEGRFYPALLRGQTQAEPSFAGYQFYFYSRGAFDVTWSIARETDGKLETQFKSERTSPQAGMVKLEWSGRTDDRKPAEPGAYRLLVRGKAVIGEDKELALQLDIPFVTYAQAPQ